MLFAMKKSMNYIQNSRNTFFFLPSSPRTPPVELKAYIPMYRRKKQNLREYYVQYSQRGTISSVNHNRGLDTSPYRRQEGNNNGPSSTSTEPEPEPTHLASPRHRQRCLRSL